MSHRSVDHPQLTRFAVAMLGGLVLGGVLGLVDWVSALPDAPLGLLAIVIPGCTIIALSTVLRSRVSLGVHRWSVAIVVAAAVYAIASWLITDLQAAQTAHLAMAVLAYVAVLAAGGRRPYGGTNRLEAITVASAVLAGVLALVPLDADLALLDLRSLMLLAITVFVLAAAFGLVIGQGWRPSIGVGLALLGAAVLLAAQLVGLGGAELDPPIWLEAVAVGLLVLGVVLGDPGLPAPDRRRVSAAVLVASVLVALVVLVQHGRGYGAGEVADFAAVLTLIAAFGRVITSNGSPHRTDPSELGGIDRLTGLPDRYELETVLERELEYAGARNMPVALAVLDLVNLHEINETLGHRVGDEVLREFAARLSGHVGTDVPVRLAGNTFAVILRSQGSEREARAALELLQARLQAPLQVDGVSLATQVRIGLVFFPAHGRTVAELLQRAEIASQEAKDKRLPLLVYDPARDLRSRERLVFAAQLREGIERDELRVFFQPKIDLATGLTTGAEALVRWQHPEEGLLTPDRFLPVAERTGQMPQLTAWVLNAALREVQRWRANGFALGVAVNLSPENLTDTALPGRLALLLERYGLRGSALELEITEDMAMADPARTAEVIRAINALGIGFALDDFGTGYSSLAHLKYLNCNELKIDRSFVRDIVSDEDDRVIVWSILDLARNLGMRTVAEGIESPEVVEMLSMMGCGVGQGFHYARPLDADAFVAWCQEQRRVGTIRLLSQAGGSPLLAVPELAGPGSPAIRAALAGGGVPLDRLRHGATDDDEDARPAPV
ncbi:MAG: bifunctional diguanylate cyclase/phosphodiesterase [Solirubrobacteraceae bacterium]|nr:bifunctional diguanylate cyclase/phosphodiesterase [Solirubrobacteraceae bacterium]